MFLYVERPGFTVFCVSVRCDKVFKFWGMKCLSMIMMMWLWLRHFDLHLKYYTFCKFGSITNAHYVRLIWASCLWKNLILYAHIISLKQMFTWNLERVIHDHCSRHFCQTILDSQGHYNHGLRHRRRRTSNDLT